jgi:hypothetical protein
LFVPKTRVLQKNKAIKLKTLHKKVILLGVLTNAQFGSKVEDLAWKLCNINEELTELEPDPLTSKEGDTLKLHKQIYL